MPPVFMTQLALTARPQFNLRNPKVPRTVFIDAGYSTRNVRSFVGLVVSVSAFIIFLIPFWRLSDKLTGLAAWAGALCLTAGNCIVGLFALRFARRFIANSVERQRIDSHEIDVFEDVYRQKILWSQVDAIRPSRPLLSRGYDLLIFYTRKAQTSGNSVFRIDGGFSLEEAQSLVELMHREVGSKYPRIDFETEPLLRKTLI